MQRASLRPSQLCCVVDKQGFSPRDAAHAPSSVVIAGAALRVLMEVQFRSRDMASAYGGNDAPLYTAVATSGRSPYTATVSGVIDERHHRPSISNPNKQRLNMGAWNVRTTKDSDSSIRPERVTALICRELEKAGIDICALSEVRRPGTGNIIERSHTIFWSGGEERTPGVGFAISNRLAAQGISPTPISDRLMSMSIQLKGGNNLTLISVYAPTMQRPQEEKERFYEKLGSCTSAADMDAVIVLDDFNARVGKDWISWPNVIGKHGVGEMNCNSVMLLEFCTRFQLSIMGTMF